MIGYLERSWEAVNVPLWVLRNVDAKRRNLRISILVAAHFVLGITFAILAAVTYGRVWVSMLYLAYIAFIMHEALLLGTWAGLSNTNWPVRLAGMLCGIPWLAAMSNAWQWQNLVPPHDLQDLFEMMIIISTSTASIAIGFITYRWFGARIDHRDEWEKLPISRELQFGLKPLLYLMALIGVLIAGGRIARRISTYKYESEAIVPLLSLLFAVCGVIAALLLVWATLRCGRFRVRIPLAIAGMSAVGLLPSYYLVGEMLEKTGWLVIANLTAALASLSLIVIRSCGYRLVPVNRGAPGIGRQESMKKIDDQTEPT